jgi:hypothetical protein
MPTGQIPIRLSRNVADRVRVYAEEQGVADSELVKLLFQRERRLRRLETLYQKGAAPVRPRKKKGEAEKMDVITVYFTPEERREFERYVATCGIKKGDAGAWLLEQELSEGWLQRSLYAA